MAATEPVKLGAILLLLALSGVRADDGSDIHCDCSQIKDEGDREQCIKKNQSFNHRAYCGFMRATQKLTGKQTFYFGWIAIVIHHISEYQFLKREGAPRDLTQENRCNLMKDASQILRVIGHNFIAFGAFFDGFVFSFVARNPFVTSIIMIFFDDVIIWGIRYVIQRMNGVRSGSPDPLWEARTIYALPCVPFCREMLTFVSQVALFLFFCVEMNALHDKLQDDRDSAQKGVWVIGVIVMGAVGEQQLGGSFSWSSWAPVIRIRKTHCSTLGRRVFSDWLVNHAFRQVILATTPILLMAEGPIDFIKDVLAICFLCTLDDPPEDKVRDAIDKIYKASLRFGGVTPQENETSNSAKEAYLQDQSETRKALLMWALIKSKAILKPIPMDETLQREEGLHC